MQRRCSRSCVTATSATHSALTGGKRWQVPGLVAKWSLETSTFLEAKTTYTPQSFACKSYRHVLAYSANSNSLSLPFLKNRLPQPRGALLVVTDASGGIAHW